MTTYDIDTLNNLCIREHATNARSKGLISKEELKKIMDAHPVDFYTPNLFVKVGLGVLTFFIALCATGLSLLLFKVGKHLTAYLIFMALVLYATLEIFTNQKKHYNSGVDNVLMITTAIFITTAIAFNDPGTSVDIIISFILFAIATWFTIRFTDSTAAAVAVISFLTFIFDAYVRLGEATISTFPFLLIGVSAVIYYSSDKASNSSNLLIYHNSLQNISLVALLAFYLSGNYWVVDELTKSSYLLQSHSSLNISWFFWIWTMVVPALIVVRGLLTKEIIFIRAGLVLVAVSIVTFKAYHHIISAEAAMVVGGSILLLITYLLMQYLKTPKNGFVFDNSALKESESNTFEALIPALYQGEHTTGNEETKFGGGSFGGAGAGGDY